MSLLTKSLCVSRGLRHCTNLFHPPKELRLTCAHHSLVLNDSLCSKSTVFSETHCKERKIPLVPDRAVTTAYFREVVKSKVAHAYDTVRYLGRTQERLLGFKWYSTLDALNFKEFIKILNLPDTFYSWFKITELHTWMLLFNLPQNTRSQRVVRIAVINAMWMDTERRSEILAPDNKQFKKNMKVLYQRFQVSLFLYDDALFNSDTDLCSALWYNFFDGENVDPRYLEVLVSYIRYQINHLSNLQLQPEKVQTEENLQIWTPLITHYNNVFFKM